MTARRPLLRVVPEPRLALVVALLSPVWLLPGDSGRIARVVALSLVALAIVVDAIALPGARDLAVERTFPPSIGIGDRVDAEYEIHSRWGRSLHARLDDDLPPGITSGGVARELVVPARGSAHLTTPVSGAARGRFALGPVALR